MSLFAERVHEQDGMSLCRLRVAAPLLVTSHESLVTAPTAGGAP